jgi:hypothetical protein
LEEVLRAQGVTPPMHARMLDGDRLQEYVAAGPQIILTDQYAPVDNLIAPLFTRRS